jgi:hypothetical protein
VDDLPTRARGLFRDHFSHAIFSQLIELGKLRSAVRTMHDEPHAVLVHPLHRPVLRTHELVTEQQYLLTACLD